VPVLSASRTTAQERRGFSDSLTAPERRFLTITGTVVVVGYVLLFVWAMGALSYDVWGALLLAPVLVLVTVPLLLRAGRHEPDRWVTKVVILALLAKLASTLVRYAVAFEVYQGSADASGYHGAGRRLAEAFWAGNYSEVYAQEANELVGTEFIRVLTGWLYIGTGPTKLGGFLVFSWLGFWGLYFSFKAFRLAFPEGDHRRYALLVFFLPSLLFWPSSLGKEAWMMFTIGIALYGAARILMRHQYGYVLFGLGLAGTAFVRPHITLLLFVSLLGAFVLRRSRGARGSFAGASKVAGLVVLLVGGSVVLAQVSDFFNLGEVDAESVEQVLDRTEGQSATGDSEFTATRPDSLAGVPGAAVGVLLRPFPWEAGNAQAFAASLEGAVLVVVALLSIRRLAALPRYLVRRPYVAMALIYTFAFAFAFAAVGNFGILARQRVQVLPLALVLLALPAVPASATTREPREP
jgi:hypothetical protein